MNFVFWQTESSLIKWLLFGLVFCGTLIPVRVWDQQGHYIGNLTDSADYVQAGERAYLTLKNKGIQSFVVDEFFIERDWRATITPYALIPMLMLTGGDVHHSVLLLNACLLFVVSLGLFFLSQCFFPTWAALLLTSAALTNSGIYFSSLALSADLSIAGLCVWSLYFWWKDQSLSLRFFVMVLLFLLFRPAEGMLFYLPFWVASSRNFYRKGLLSHRTMFWMSLALGVQAAVFIYLFYHPTWDVRLMIAFWATSLMGLTLLGIWGWKRAHWPPLQKGFFVVLGGTWLWYLPAGDSVVGWLYNCSFGPITQNENAKANMGLVDQILRWANTAGWAPLVLFLIGGAFFFFQRRQDRSAILTLGAAIFLMPLVGLLSPNADLRYYHINFLLIYLIGFAVLFQFFLWAGRTNIFLAGLPLLAIWGGLQGMSASRPAWIFGDKIDGIGQYQVDGVDRFLDSLNQVPAQSILIPFRVDSPWDQISGKLADIRSLERGLPFRFSSLFYHFPQEQKICRQNNWWGPRPLDAILIADPPNPVEEPRDNLALFNFLAELQRACDSPEELCPFQPRKPLIEKVLQWDDSHSIRFKIYQLKDCP